ncbi:MAG: heme-binding domain-containing protein [Bdellovibrionales bacterium]|nr:heme-binding domain-containing protein [Bdellovibrionales bacterium]
MRLTRFVSLHFLFYDLCPQEPSRRSNDAGASEAPNDQLSRINELYKDKVKPIFQKKCFDCHSQNTQYPLVLQIPGARQLIDGDIEEAKEHLDFTNDFPFGGMGSHPKT